MPTRNTVKAKQLLLREAGLSVKVDGIEGPQTQNAIKAVQKLGPAFAQIEQMFGEAAKLVRESNDWIPVQELMVHVNKAAQYVPFSAPQIKWMIDMEAAKKQFDGVLHYQVDYGKNVSGGPKGLGQFFPGAWQAAKERAIIDKVPYTLKPFLTGVFEAEQAVVAVGLYMTAVWAEANSKLRGNGFKPLLVPSLDVIYALYNQGPDFATKAARLQRQPPLTKGVKQSDAAMPILARAAKEIINEVA